MKTRLALLASLALTATLAFAGNSYLGTGYSAVVAPSGTSAGFALANPASAKGFTVTVADARDGSVGDALDQVLTFNATAYCLNTKAAICTSGACTSLYTGWTHVPALDLTGLIADAGTGIAGGGYHSAIQASTAVTVLGVECNRVEYVINSLNASYDGGVLVTRTTIAEQN